MSSAFSHTPDRAVLAIRAGDAPTRESLLARALPLEPAPHLLPRSILIAKLSIALLIEATGDAVLAGHLLAAERAAQVNDAITAADGSRDLMREARAA